MPEVLQARYAARPQGSGGTPESLRNHLSISDMGSRAVHEESATAERPADPAPFSGPSRSRDEILAFIYKYMPDIPHESLGSAADAVISAVRDASLGDEDTREEVCKILGSGLATDEFNILCNLCQRIPDDEAPVAGFLGLSDSEEEDEDDEEEEDETEDQEPTEANLNEFDDTIVVSGTTLNPQDINGSWLAAKIAFTGKPLRLFLDLLASHEPEDVVEESLLQLLGGENLELVRLLVDNRDMVYWLTMLHRSETGAERDSIANQIRNAGLELNLESPDIMNLDSPSSVDLELLRERGAYTHQMAKVRLPEASTRFSTRFYEQYNVPAVPCKSKDDSHLVAVSELPEYVQPLFKGVRTLNAMQSQVHAAALDSDDNLLLCAPTGAGKTNVALMAMARCFESRPKAKVVYLAPLKALVQEQVRTFSHRFQDQRKVCEMSGDQSLGPAELESADVIVATPEKWDVVTRKPENARNVGAQVGLLVIDEIHLLHDQRGPVLESVVARFLREFPHCRLAGLSATLPNYRDVAAFLRATPFLFGAEYRPCPLAQTYVGVTAANPLRKLRNINEACWDKVVEALDQGFQMIVFVQSRKDTVQTADFLLEKAHQTGRDDLFPVGKLSKDDVNDDRLQNRGLGVHHAGLNREQRHQTESAFANGSLRVLVSTATLAWGVNLPAHTVIIKGTQFYDPAGGAWTELAPQDVLQMLGRAGRPGFDVNGEGIIITGQTELNYYMSVSTSSLAIESQLYSRIVDAVNAEICYGSITTLDEGVEWLGYTYLYVRMLRSPERYRVQLTENEKDEVLLNWRRRLIHTAFTELMRLRCAHYSYPKVHPTELGRVAANFYISPVSAATYSKQLKPWLQTADLFRVFALSAEFALLPVRQAEKQELERLTGLTPVPIRDASDTRAAKMQVLLQAYICRLRLPGTALVADTSYVAQNACRLFRAMLEVAVVRRWASLAETLLDLCKMVEMRCWLANTPFRQLGASSELIRRTEVSQMPWSRYFDLDTEEEVGTILRSQELGAEAWTLLKRFPRVQVEVQSQPLTPTVLILHVDIQPIFAWDTELHSSSVLFWLSAADVDGRRLLAWERVTLNLRTGHQSTQIRTLVLLLHENPGPVIYVRLFSDRWLHSTTTMPVDLRRTQWPAQFAPPALPTARKDVPLVLESNRPALFGAPDTSHWLQHALASHANDNVLVVTPSPHIIEGGTSLREPSPLMVATAEEYELETRHFNRSVLPQVQVVICVDIHRVGTLGGHLYEAAISRTRFWAERLELDIQFIGLGLPLANVRETGAWLGAAKHDVASFVDHSRTLKLDVTACAPGTQLNRAAKLAGGSDSCLLIVPDAMDEASLKRELDGNPKIITRESLVDVSQHDKVVIVGTQFWDGPDTGFIDYTASEVAEILRLAISQGIVLTTPQRQRYYAKFLSEPLPIESSLPAHMTDILATEIANGSVSSAEDAMEFLTHTLFWRRLLANPSYYGVDAGGDINEFLSDLVEDSFQELTLNGAVNIVDEETLAVEALAGVHISAHHGVSTRTIALFADSRPKSLLAAAVLAPEIGIPLRRDDSRYAHLLSQLPLGGDFETVSGKALVLLQLHMSRAVPRSLRKDTDTLIAQILRVLRAAVDALAGKGHIGALAALDTHQQIVQAIWPQDSPLMQIPHVDETVALRFNDAGIKTVYDFVGIEDDSFRASLLGFDNENPYMLDVAAFANHWPSLDARAWIETPIRPGVALEVKVEIEREIDDDDDTRVIAPLSFDIQETWYLIVGNSETRELYGITTATLDRPFVRTSVNIRLPSIPTLLTLWVICSGYVDADTEIVIEMR